MEVGVFCVCFFIFFCVFFFGSVRPCCWIQCSDAFIYCRLARFTSTSVIVKPDVGAGRRPLFLWVLSPVFLRLSKPSLLRSTFYRNIFFFFFSTFFIAKTVALSCICLLHQLRCKTTNLLFLIFLFYRVTLLQSVCLPSVLYGSSFTIRGRRIHYRTCVGENGSNHFIIFFHLLGAISRISALLHNI